MDDILCAVYMRVSTNDQAKEGYGLDTQKRHCEAMAMLKSWKIIEYYIDDGVSGTLWPISRPALSKLVTDAENKKFSGLIFYSLDRLGRTSRIVLDTIDYLNKQCNIELISCKESIDTSKATGKFVLRMFSSLAELERQNISSRLLEGRKERKLKDGETGGRIPYGYARINKSILVNEEQAKIVKLIFERKFNGCTLSYIADELNSSGIPSPGNSNWIPKTIHRILSKKDVYLGYNRNDSQVCWPQIISDIYEDCSFVTKRPRKNQNKIKKENKIKTLESQGVCVSLITDRYT